MLQIDFSRRFVKQFDRLRHAEQNRFNERLELWQKEPKSPTLHVHALTGKYRGFYSLNVGGDLRALYKIVGDTAVLFDFIGTHSQLYG